MNLWKEYISERERKQVLEKGSGFVVYSVDAKAETLLIHDIFVSPKHRQKGLAGQMADELCVLAKEKGCKQLLSQVWLNTGGADDALHIQLHYGLKMIKADNDVILLGKDI